MYVNKLLSMGTGIEDEISVLCRLTKGYSVQKSSNNQMYKTAPSADVENITNTVGS